LADVRRFYRLLDTLEKRQGGKRRLEECDGRFGWPIRGVYFFFEDGEERSDSGRRLRVVRVGTHALTDGARTTLWNRLSQHRGTVKTGGGNHRGSIFRLLVGTAVLATDGNLNSHTWGKGSSAPRDVREPELPVERRVSEVIRAMPFLWLAVDDPPGRTSLRGRIESNSTALLSTWDIPPLDRSSAGWLGRSSNRVKVQKSGLWNSRHVDEPYDRHFLSDLERLVLSS